MKTIISIIIAVLLFAGFILVLNEGIKRSEEVECFKWQAQSEQFINRYSTGWQKEQCRTYGIELK